MLWREAEYTDQNRVLAGLREQVDLLSASLAQNTANLDALRERCDDDARTLEERVNRHRREIDHLTENREDCRIRELDAQVDQFGLDLMAHQTAIDQLQTQICQCNEPPRSPTIMEELEYAPATTSSSGQGSAVTAPEIEVPLVPMVDPEERELDDTDSEVEESSRGAMESGAPEEGDGVSSSSESSGPESISSASSVAPLPVQ